jgi:hypothetical protein
MSQYVGPQQSLASLAMLASDNTIVNVSPNVSNTITLYWYVGSPGTYTLSTGNAGILTVEDI